MPPDLIRMIDEAAARDGRKRSQFIAHALRQVFARSDSAQRRSVKESAR
jgi:metal-responsive CopG/Arc/MetJ family transcriptional regulator